jgi:hypothetical protein
MDSGVLRIEPKVASGKESVPHNHIFLACRRSQAQLLRPAPRALGQSWVVGVAEWWRVGGGVRAADKSEIRNQKSEGKPKSKIGGPFLVLQCFLPAAP